MEEKITFKEFLKLLTPEQKKQYLKNCDSLKYMEAKKDNPISFLLSGFFWTDTPEGHEYWSSVLDSIDEKLKTAK